MNWKEILDGIKSDAKDYAYHSKEAKRIGKKVGVKKINKTKDGTQYTYKDGTGYYIENPKTSKNKSKK